MPDWEIYRNSVLSVSLWFLAFKHPSPAFSYAGDGCLFVLFFFLRQLPGILIYQRVIFRMFQGIQFNVDI